MGTQPIGKLMLKFAIPSIASSLINAIYNITDQVFIGRSVGYLGNAATNITFPIITLCIAVTIMIGSGSSSKYSLHLGAGKKDEAADIAGTGISMLAIFGVTIGILTFILTEPLMRVFGATDLIFPYAVTYTRIIAVGIPFVLFATGLSNLIRADGSPGYSLFTLASGAVLNMILDPIFIFALKMGIAGAAYATVISQIVSFFIAFGYLRRFKNSDLTGKIPLLKAECVKTIAKLGLPGFTNHFMMMVIQITMNNTLRFYGAASIYGSDIPLAVVGVISKLSIVVIAFNVGIALGCQPIFGFNFGAKNYARVKETYKRAAVAVVVISMMIFACFQLFPRQIVSIFGTGDELYFQFAERYMRIYLMMVCLFGLQPLTANFFTSVGKAYKGLFITVTRQGLFLFPLLLILPRFLGFDGIVYAGPISDSAAIMSAIIFAFIEFKTITKLEKAQSAERSAGPG
ncbi:MAG: MATE family efflux transporter [Oscillospiraceae bacterium]|nr:MATE family efflux transporter [Oscillospiraceae bacterium]